MRAIFIWEGDFGSIDISGFSHLKLRKDGQFDRRRKDDYYKELNEFIRQREKEICDACESAWDDARI